MSSMFEYCYGLTFIPVENWDVLNVTNMINIFLGCKKLVAIPVDKWYETCKCKINDWNVYKIEYRCGDSILKEVKKLTNNF